MRIRFGLGYIRYKPRFVTAKSSIFSQTILLIVWVFLICFSWFQHWYNHMDKQVEITYNACASIHRTWWYGHLFLLIPSDCFVHSAINLHLFSLVFVDKQTPLWDVHYYVVCWLRNAFWNFSLATGIPMDDLHPHPWIQVIRDADRCGSRSSKKSG